MIYKIMNDFELVYLIKTQEDSVAFDFLYQKYQKFIWKCIHLLNIDQKEQEDFFQEGILILYKAAQTFDESKNKTFTRYFELILKRHFYQMISKLPKYLLYEDSNFMECFAYYESEDPWDFIKNCSEFEQQIYQAYFIEKQAVKRISKNLCCDSKKIYNAIFRIKEKYKNVI
ncbi:MAG: sigma-70 family RNA polymerase sigma factor [Acholeplasmataceae bacterium]